MSVVKIVLMLSLYADRQSMQDSFLAIEETHSIIVVLLLSLWGISIITELLFLLKPLLDFCVNIIRKVKRNKKKGSVGKDIRKKMKCKQPYKSKASKDVE